MKMNRKGASRKRKRLKQHLKAKKERKRRKRRRRRKKRRKRQQLERATILGNADQLPIKTGSWYDWCHRLTKDNTGGGDKRPDTAFTTTLGLPLTISKGSFLSVAGARLTAHPHPPLPPERTAMKHNSSDANLAAC